MINKLLSHIKESDSIVIHSHIYPDGDAYGSQIGLKEFIKENFPGKKVYVVGSGLPNFFSMLGKPDEIDDEIALNSLHILVDASEDQRFENNYFELSEKRIYIDHHILNYEPFSLLSIFDVNASSTSEIIARLLFQSGLKINKRCANALLLGLITDTGRYQYLKDPSITFNIALKLISFGANQDEILKLLNVVNERELDIKIEIYKKIIKDKCGLIYVSFTSEDLKRLKLKSHIACNYVNLLANVKGYPVWFIQSETEEGGMRYEFRSRDLDIQSIAKKYGGGGHKTACGLTLYPENLHFKDNVFEDLKNLVMKEGK